MSWLEDNRADLKMVLKLIFKTVVLVINLNVTKMYFEMTLVLTLVLAMLKKTVDLDATSKLDVDESDIDNLLLAQLALPFVASVLATIKYAWGSFSR